MECEIEKLPDYVVKNICRVWEEGRDGSNHLTAAAFYHGLANGSHANGELFREALFLVFVVAQRFRLTNGLED